MVWNDNENIPLNEYFWIFVKRVPPNLRDEWDPDGKLEKPDVDFEVEWVYGYRGKDASGGRNIYQVREFIRI